MLSKTNRRFRSEDDLLQALLKKITFSPHYDADIFLRKFEI